MSDREDKKAQFAQTSARGISPLSWALGAALLVAVATVSWLLLGGQASAGHTEVKARDGFVEISLAEVSDGKAYFFTYRDAGKETHFFVLKSFDGQVRAALDACDVCYHAGKGYRQEGDNMVCINCNMAFRSDRINEVEGGCNPTPLERTIRDGKLLLSAAELSAKSWYFPIYKR